MLLRFVCQPCTHADLGKADLLSKPADRSDWQLLQKMVSQQAFCKRGWGQPNLDCFASEFAWQCKPSFPVQSDRGCSAVDGLMHLCKKWPPGGGQQQGRPLSFVFPPRSCWCERW